MTSPILLPQIGTAVTPPPDTAPSLETEIADEARRLGFQSVGITAASLRPEVSDAYRRFLDAGLHGDMAWMADTADRRSDPGALWGEAKSVIVVTANYGPETDPLAQTQAADRGLISVYARNKDYHDVLKKRLKALARWLVARVGGDVKVFVDTAPILEKPLAAQAGTGWQGKHTNLVSRDYGSWLFLGEVFTTLELKSDPPEDDHCGTCRRCLDICPTDAFIDAYRLDARRCISYLTIEHKGHIPRDLRPLMGNRIYGCDDCLAVCPWNKFAHLTEEDAFKARADLDLPLLAELAALDDSAFRQKFAGSPVKRIGRERFVRNVLIALGNSGRDASVPAVVARLDDDSPLVRAMAVWALGRLDDGVMVKTERARRLDDETDDGVRSEWAALGP